ncbi:MAG: hypothetical protein JWN48_731 [Myxococcaceae bacterium]|nr:hypothetical protein [Myxococcaceae bacterium]
MSLLGIDREGSSSDSSGSAGSTFTSRPVQTTISGRAPAPRWASPWWLLFLGLAIAEVVALGVREHRVPTETDWAGAADYVRSQLAAQDAITVAPGWADPLLRLYLGDRMTAKISGRSDLAAFERLWVLSIRGANAPDAPKRAPNFSQTFGRVRVERFDLGPSKVLVDLVDAIHDARVTRRIEGIDDPCILRTFPPSVLQGGLGGGIVAPRQRFQCDFERHWLWVGQTLIESLDLSPRRCVWSHPQGADPISITYPDIPLGTRIVLYGGLDYHDERDREKGPVTLRVLLNEREIGSFVHRDGDGMARYEIDLRRELGAAQPGATLPQRGDLKLEVSAAEPYRRSFCWAGSTQSGVRKEAP